jgi:hypothetical protein
VAPGIQREASVSGYVVARVGRDTEDGERRTVELTITREAADYLRDRSRPVALDYVGSLG